MKVIISHDIDHLTATEHFGDGIISKQFVRSNIELFSLKIKGSEYFYRLKSIFENKWNYLDELMEFDKKNNVCSTFFIGIRNGKGLSYSKEQAAEWVVKIRSNSFPVHLHSNSKGGDEQRWAEIEEFLQMTGEINIGIRTHYLENIELFLSQNGKTPKKILFDSSCFEFKDAYCENGICRFPVHLMDSRIMENGRKWQSRSLEQAIKYSEEKINEALENNFSYFVVNFHDRYFSNEHKAWKDWYMWIIEKFKRDNISFVSFSDAQKEILSAR
ncbi:MAG: hypothetical protein IAF38_01350 [Bacteroidia bacterium]|nr:hypothetical protein [Bacteroidia bacterium]